MELFYGDLKKEDGCLYSYSYLLDKDTNEKKNYILNTPYLIVEKKPYCNNSKWFMDLIIPSEEKEFFKKISNFEENMFDIIVNNKDNWFPDKIINGKKYRLTIEVLDEFRVPLMRFNKDHQCKIKLEISKNINIKDLKNIENGEKIKFEMEYLGIKFRKHHFANKWFIKNFYYEETDNYYFGDQDELNITDSFLTEFVEEENILNSLEENRKQLQIKKKPKQPEVEEPQQPEVEEPQQLEVEEELQKPEAEEINVIQKQEEKSVNMEVKNIKLEKIKSKSKKKTKKKLFLMTKSK